jgi:hypothetical protein
VDLVLKTGRRDIIDYTDVRPLSIAIHVEPVAAARVVHPHTDLGDQDGMIHHAARLCALSRPSGHEGAVADDGAAVHARGVARGGHTAITARSSGTWSVQVGPLERLNQGDARRRHPASR